MRTGCIGLRGNRGTLFEFDQFLVGFLKSRPFEEVSSITANSPEKDEY